MCLGDNVLAWCEARVATVGRGGDGPFVIPLRGTAQPAKWTFLL